MISPIPERKLPLSGPLSSSEGRESPYQKTHEQMHPGQISPRKVPVPEDFVWKTPPPDMTDFPDAAILSLVDDVYTITYRSPSRGSNGFAGLDELPKTVEELEEAVREAIIESEREAVPKGRRSRSPSTKALRASIDKIRILEPVIEKKTEALLRTLVETGKLNNEEVIEAVRKQLTNSLTYIDQNRISLTEQAREDPDGSIYLRPKDQNLSEGCHIQVCSDGTVYLIPKQDDLFLGEGEFKRVRLAIEEHSEKLAAAISVSEAKEYFEKEVRLIRSIDPDLIHSTIFDKGKHAKGKGIIPYAKHGDLGNALKNKVKVPTQKLMQLLAGQVALLHEKGIIIRDLKLANILLAEEKGEPVIWILDLGLADFQEESTVDKLLDATPHMMPPEAVAYQIDPTRMIEDPKEKIDIYDLAMVLWHIQEKRETDLLPWLNARDVSGWIKDKKDPRVEYRKLFEEYAKNHPEVSLPDSMDETFTPSNQMQLIAWAAHWDPQKRPSAERIAEIFKVIKDDAGSDGDI